jgi:hypothetical protein
MKATLVIRFAASVMLLASPAHADDKDACLDASLQGQTLRDAHRLVEARDKFRACAQQTCPVVVQTDCTSWFDAAERAVPTVVLSAKDGARHDVVDVAVTLDGQPLVMKLDGQALPVNPGPHTFRFERTDGTAATVQLLLGEGEKVRSVSAVLGGATGTSGTSVTTDTREGGGDGMRTAGWIVGGVGVVALVTGVVLVAVGSGDRGECGAGGACPNQAALDKYNSGTPLLNASYGLLAGGGVAAAAGVVLWLTSPRAAKPETTRTGGIRVGVAPTGVALSGEFE